ncbi:uncharacterized protein I206_105716 [Kwoniella pini CBS 10737]|uniref:Methyltransferase type 11 domain-containing protein n=1 Tax=Kwoniella pini CBS 10737 TaxID=1296096 RepID=A0A1B9I3H0_9TREE|nr:uncharacterized protein I206_03381 [Kwoniella pini CBS 10737]OCF50065.1 hypothetical protein I206_03381 [Kwoniella pini CBS 10737]
MSNKFTKEQWLTATPSEFYLGTEEMTIPAGEQLISQSGLIEGLTNEKKKVLDIGAGLGQVTSSILNDTKNRKPTMSQLEITVGEIDDSLLKELNNRKEERKWDLVKVEKTNAISINKPNDTFDFIYANFLYFLLQDPIKGLRESIRVLKSGGKLSFSTWSYSGPFHLIQHAIALLPYYPLLPPSPTPGGQWTHPEYLRQILQEEGMTEIEINPYEFIQTALNTEDMARKMHHVVKIVTNSWGIEQQELGWKVFEKIEELLRRNQGDGEVKITSVALIITAKKP